MPKEFENLPEWTRYLIGALVILLFLFIIGVFAPELPTLCFCFIFLLYALPASFGPMYLIVTNRKHRQLKLNPEGTLLSPLNRKWRVWFGFYFFAGLLSAFLFVLQSPSWGLREWVFVFLLVPVFYCAYLLVSKRIKKELNEPYSKATSIVVSIVISALIVCLLYAFFAIVFSPHEEVGIRQILQERVLYFSDSPSALLSEAEKISTYFDYLTQYGLNLVTSSSLLAAVLIKFIVSMAVFLGISSLLGSCLLSIDDIKDEFRLLSVEGEAQNKRSITVSYITLLAVIWLAFDGVFLVTNYMVKQLQAADQYTWIDQRLDETTDAIILATEYSVGQIKDTMESTEAVRKFNEEFIPRRDSYIEEHESKLDELIGAYYEACEANLDGYLDWYDSGFGTFAKQVKFVGAPMAEGAFDSQVVDPVSRDEIDSAYAEYINGLKDLYVEYADAQTQLNLVANAVMRDAEDIVKSLPSKPILWPAWDTKEGKSFAKDVLLHSDEGATRDDVKDKILEYIVEHQSAVDVDISNLSKAFFPI